eukprot:1138310-Pelagomonas_calceolata.AAC.1
MHRSRLSASAEEHLNYMKRMYEIGQLHTCEAPVYCLWGRMLGFRPGSDSSPLSLNTNLYHPSPPQVSTHTSIVTPHPIGVAQRGLWRFSIAAIMGLTQTLIFCCCPACRAFAPSPAFNPSSLTRLLAAPSPQGIDDLVGEPCAQEPPQQSEGTEHGQCRVAVPFLACGDLHGCDAEASYELDPSTYTLPAVIQVRKKEESAPATRPRA